MGPITDPRPLAEPPSLEELLERNPQLKKESIDYLQSWMAKQPHLPRIPDELLVSFLHTSHYSLERAKTIIENHFTIRTHAPELFRARDLLDPEAQKQIPLVEAGPFRKKDADGNRIWAVRFASSGDASKIDYDVCVKLGMMILDYIVREDPTCAGNVLVMDAKGATMAHAVNLRLSTIKKLMKYTQDGLNVRLVAVHVINVAPVVEYVHQLFKPLYNKDFVDKVHIHSGSLKDFHKIIPRDILPKDYGGTLGDMAEVYDYSYRCLEKSRQWFLDNEYLVDEQKRPGKQKSASEVFGIEGSFRKLEID